MNIQTLRDPIIAVDPERIFDESISPLTRLSIMSSREFEDITALWLKESINIRYSNIAQIGGSKDAGRDIVAYAIDDPKSFDVYQCKHYKNPLVPSQYWVEFGKLCYHTFVQRYGRPSAYYIVASNGIGDNLRYYIEHSAEINNALLNAWPKHCGKKKQIVDDGIQLTTELEEYIKAFDFSIVQEITPLRLLHESENTKWYKYYFGGGLKQRHPVQFPLDDVDAGEETLPYVSQLLKVYSESVESEIDNIDTLRTHPQWMRHLRHQRHSYFSAQQLARFARDELLDDTAYTQIKTEVNYAVEFPLRQVHPKAIDRVDQALASARSLRINNPILRAVNTLDTCGMCHELVNDGEIKWYEKEKTDTAI